MFPSTRLTTAALVLLSAAPVAAADQWSQPTKTETWSAPTKTDTWAKPTTTGVWSESGASTPAGNAQGPARVAAVGDRVQILSSGKWSPGSVLALGEGTFRVRYDGWSADWDEWVSPDRLRFADGTAVAAPPASPKPPVAAPKPSESPRAPVAAPPSRPVESPPPPPSPSPGKATPGKAYGLANQWRYQTLTFRAPDGTTTDASRDVGGTLTLFPNGQFRQRLVIGEFVNETHGTWKAKGDRLTLTYQWNRHETETLTFAISGPRLSLTLGGRKGERTTFYGLQLAGTCDAHGNCAPVATRP